MTTFFTFQFETDGAPTRLRVGLGGQGGHHGQTVPASMPATTNGKRVTVLSKTVVHENKKNQEPPAAVADETEEPLIEVLQDEDVSNGHQGGGNKTTVAVINATNVTNNGQVHETHL